MNKKVIKYCCLGALVILLSWPMFKEHTLFLSNTLEVEPLKGYFPPVDVAGFSLKTWMDGSYQKKQEAFLKQNLKIQPYATRVNNQLHFDVLSEIRSDVVEGKDDYLFGARYLGAIQGRDFIGSDKIKTQCKKLAFVREERQTN